MMYFTQLLYRMHFTVCRLHDGVLQLLVDQEYTFPHSFWDDILANHNHKLLNGMALFLNGHCVKQGDLTTAQIQQLKDSWA